MSVPPPPVSQGPPVLRFLFDYLSPYAWLAWRRLPPIAARHGWTIEPTPVLLAGFLGHFGHKGPAEIAPKRVYVFKDCLRQGALHGIPVVPPPSHPFNPLLALRVSGLDVGEEARSRLVGALFAAAWGGDARHGRDLSDPAVVAAIATSLGLDGPALVHQAGLPHNKGRLRADTDAAIAAGVFGVPSMLAGGELFWGTDSLEHLDRFLGGGDPVDAALLLRWRDLPSSAGR